MKAETKVTVSPAPPEPTLSQQIGMEIWKQGTTNIEQTVSRADIIKMLPPHTEVGTDSLGGAVVGFKDIVVLLEYNNTVTSKLNQTRMSSLWEVLRILRNDISVLTRTKATKVQRDIATHLFKEEL